ncbi:hypothetical protein [Vibrio tapetis]|uniref:Uncharacterized protein n=1 Tax=Vibrio tapetis subsp. tapetis TaxID=1671868 RepID=A0A2N8ZML1_9VIBR|nr:hypothetical protein [Vibrio tapetis]SON53086.1 protein of unknown function [Vibrio tapetis subsp. tapetis]
MMRNKLKQKNIQRVEFFRRQLPKLSVSLPQKIRVYRHLDRVKHIRRHFNRFGFELVWQEAEYCSLINMMRVPHVSHKGVTHPAFNTVFTDIEELPLEKRHLWGRIDAKEHD